MGEYEESVVPFTVTVAFPHGELGGEAADEGVKSSS
jgi:hypothetical protein